MTLTSLLSPLTRRTRWRGIQGLCYNEKGISAVEFALIAPVMVLLYLGCIELSLMMRADRRITTTSASLGDLAARLSVVTDADMREMFQAANVLMQPHSAATARMRITSVADTGDGQPRVQWSDGYNITAHAPNTILSVPAGIIPPNGSVIVSEVEFDYSSSLGFVIDTTRTMKDTFYLRPRRVIAIERQTEGGSGPPAFGPGT